VSKHQQRPTLKPLHKPRHTRLLGPTAAGHVERLDVVLADEGEQALAWLPFSRIFQALRPGALRFHFSFGGLVIRYLFPSAGQAVAFPCAAQLEHALRGLARESHLRVIRVDRHAGQRVFGGNHLEFQQPSDRGLRRLPQRLARRLQTHGKFMPRPADLVREFAVILPVDPVVPRKFLRGRAGCVICRWRAVRFRVVPAHDKNSAQHSKGARACPIFIIQEAQAGANQVVVVGRLYIFWRRLQIVEGEGPKISVHPSKGAEMVKL
jgi:hypothetical protein